MTKKKKKKKKKKKNEYFAFQNEQLKRIVSCYNNKQTTKETNENIEILVDCLC